MEETSGARPITLPGEALPLTRRRLHFVRVIALLTGVLAVAGLSASMYSYMQVDQAERTIRAQLNESADTFAQVATSLQNASDTSLHAAATADDAQVSLAGASTTLTHLAGTLDQSGSALDVAIPGLGVHPFAGAQSNFREQATEVRDLVGSVDATRNSVAGNATDLRTLSMTVGSLAETMRAHARQLRDFSGSGGGANLATITTPVRILLAYSILMHLLLLGIGGSLWVLAAPDRHPRAVPGDGRKGRWWFRPRGRTTVPSDECETGADAGIEMANLTTGDREDGR